ncbi:MAG: tRNA pseudouridine(38-40) synthase TruA [Desulfoprunum sp.]|nr:tRNA pseudouridine(38-40) synthase TruA [Desulfoprunum sp.]
MRNIRLLIAFDGTGYNGWQRQKFDATVQGEIEDRLALMTKEVISLHGAGRTDAGVHAEGMVANFLSESRISCPTFFQGLNSLLPGAIRILQVSEESPDFHARFSAKGKHYQYTISTDPVLMPAERLYSLHVPLPLDEAALSECLACLIGTHDFASFENAGSRDKTRPNSRGSVRTLSLADGRKTGNHRYTFSFIGDGFLRQMVRNLVGTLLEVGLGRRTVEGFQHSLAAKKRSTAGPSAPPQGLTLKEVFY